jgi:glycosyltransferase involved in cell wall biosynthesis
MIGNSVAASKKAIVFFPHNPYPPQSGAHRRCLSMLNGLQAVGYEVTLLSSTQFTDNPWTADSIQYFQEQLNIAVEIHETPVSDYHYTAYAGERVGQVVNFAMFTPPGLQQRFRQLFHQISPDLIMINYSLWGGLAIAAEFQSALRIIDTIDLYSRNLKMNYALSKHTPKTPIHPEDVDPIFTQEDFFAKFDVEATPDEYWIYDQYDYTIAISPSEAKAMREHTKNTTVEYIPITLNPDWGDNLYAGDPLLAIGPNPFNLQGYCYFTQKILPLVLKQFPTFNLQVVGSSCQHLRPVPGTQLLGFVRDLTPLYLKSRFAICPLIGGTGQQVKIVESMAHGVPVIALKNLAESSPIEHGVNGLIAQDAQEFAKYTIQLLQDQTLCRRLGEAARNSIARSFSEQTLVETLGVLVHHAEAALIKRVEKQFPTVVIDGIFFQINQTGIARVWASLLEEWVKTGFAQHIVVLDRAATAPKITGIRYRSIQPYNYSKTAIDAEVLQAICDEEGADLFISTYYTTPTSTPSVFMTYDMIPEVLQMDLSTPDWQEKRLGILHASQYITISESTACDLIKFFPHISEQNVTVAHCGIDLNFSPAIPEEINQFKTKYNISKPYFILVGERIGVNGYKNAELCFKALSQINNCDELAIVCIGGKEQLEPELAALSERATIHLLRLSDEDLRRAYSGAIGLVYPSLYEGFGLPIAEAMACGCPVVTCRNSSILEVAGEAVLYISPSDPAEMAAALKTLQNEAVRQHLIQMGLAQSKIFSWSKMANIVADVLIGTATSSKSEESAQMAAIWTEFRKAQRQLQQVTITPQHDSAQFQAIQAELQAAQSDLKSAQDQLNQAKSRLEDTQARLQDAEGMVAAMKTSKFWKIRRAWFKIKKALGLPLDDE